VSRIAFVAPLLWFVTLAAPAQDFQGLQKNITDFVLPNGIRFVVAERHGAPTIAVRLYVRAGSVNDPAGQSGLSFLLQRATMEGTETIGTRDAAAERKALDSAEEALDRNQAEHDKGAQADEGKIATLKVEVARAVSAARTLGNPAEFTEALLDGGIGWAVQPAAEATMVESTVPSNKAELWFLLASQVVQRPVFRHFYEDRDDLAATYQTRVENIALTRLLAALSSAAFTAHPYRNRVVGLPSDIAELRMNEARQFFNRYWAPGNITIGMAGDIAPAEAKRLAEHYFAPIAARPLPPPIHTVEPEQRGPRTIVLEPSAQPMMAVGYKRPDQFDRDDAALEVARAILGGGGPSSWLNHDLIETKHLASSVQIQATYPGGRYPNLFAIVAVVATGHTADEVEKGISDTIGRLQAAPVDEASLARGRAIARENIVARLGDNAGIAAALARVTGEFGDWHKLLTMAQDLNQVTAAQVQIVALKYLTAARRTSVHMDSPPPATLPSRGGSR
jgi:predicted Zn-dependent peptidase